MDEIYVSFGMPCTLYLDNSVPPHTYIQRSLDGPVFSLLCSALSLMWWRFSRSDHHIHNEVPDQWLEAVTTFVESITP